MIDSVLSGLEHLGWVAYLIIFIAAFLESIAIIGVFFPGQIVVVLAGALATQGYFSLEILFVVVIVATILGNIIGYELGLRHMEYFRSHPKLWKYIEYAVLFFHDHGRKSVFMGQFVGLVRHALPLAAGILGMPRLTFHATNTLAIVLWAIVYLGLGYAFGAYVIENAAAFVHWLQRAWALIIILVLATIFIIRRWEQRRCAKLHTVERL